MNEEKPHYIYKMLLTEEQYEDLKALVISNKNQCSHEDDFQRNRLKLTAAVVLAAKEARE